MVQRPSNESTGLAHAFLQFFSHSIWEYELAQFGRVRAWGIKLARIGFLATRGFVQNRCLVRAAALTYVTILSIVPLLAVSFAAAKGFGFYDELIHETVEPFLDEHFTTPAPDPESSEQVAQLDEGGVETTEGAPEADAAASDGAQISSDGAAEPTTGESAEPEAAGGAAASVEPQGGQDLRSTIDEVLGFVQQTNFKTIGFPALILFLYTIIKMLGTVEGTFNEIWGVTRSRSVIRKVSDYLSMVVITPLLLFLGTSVRAATDSNAEVFDEIGLGSTVRFIAGLGSWFAIFGGFTFLYMAMPNTKVRLSSAMLGGVAGSILWLVVVVAHVKFQVGIARTNAIYSSFAALPIFLVFVNLCWIVVLVGAELAFAHQSEPTYREVERPYPNDPAVREVIAVRASARIARRFVHGHPPPTPGELALELGVPVRPVQDVLARLADAKVLAETEKDEDVAYLPARPLDALRVLDVLIGVRGRVAAEDAPARAPVDSELDRMLEGIAEEAARSEQNLTLRELAELSDSADEGVMSEAQREVELRGQGSARSATT